MKKWKFALLFAVLVFALAACAPKNTNPPDGEPTGGAELTGEAGPTAKPTATPKPTEIPVKVKDVLGRRGIKAGTCMSYYMSTNKKSLEIIKENFNSITFENEMKPDAILDHNASKQAGDIVVRFNNNTLSMLNWCKENNMAMRGHTIVWYSQTPNWIFYEDFDTSKSLVSREVMLARMESYIRQVFERLEETGCMELFYAYDVVNEAWMEDGKMRDCLWLQTIGEDYLWYAFYFADKYAPEYIDLYYNDYNEQFKTDTLYEFVQTLVDENGNYLIDGIGFQAHLYTEDSLEDYFATMDKLANLGVKISLTELDVCLGSWPNIKAATDANLKVQGQFYYNLIKGILQRVDAAMINMDALTFWGFSDAQSWRSERSPLLFNKNYKEKYAYYGVLQIKELAGFEE
ncbi:MAG: endo-1,4-beta-xylanase [Lachnospiraceae bacterium]|nr:endo-1,4-beta-xylanase [Lachnospiraceae bacterium]